MKISNLVLSIVILIVLTNCSRQTGDMRQGVNAIIGNISYVETFGNQPNKETNEDLRLKAHLNYVEKLLRGKDVSHLTKKQQENRYKIIGLIREYWTAGVFPRNYDYPDKRIPCFIDKNGNICAVGYLIEHTAGRQVAEKINESYKYEYVLAMNDPTVDSWIHSSGLTKEECAMIQPTYGPAPTSNYISPSYGISSSIIGGLNLSLGAINGIQISKGANSKFIPILGLITGAGQITLGAFNYPSQPYWSGTYNSSQRNLSLINIGIGTGTMIMSGWNLLTNRKPKEKSLTWNIYSFPTPTGNTGFGFNLTKRL